MEELAKQRRPIVRFKNIIITLLILCLVLCGASYLSTLEATDSRQLNFCLSSQCIRNFAFIFSGPISIIKAGVFLIGAFVSISGVYIALKNYIVSVSSSALTGYVNHLNLFRSFITDEIEVKTHITRMGVDPFSWHLAMFPQASFGDINIYPSYNNLIETIIKEIEYTSSSITKPTSQIRYDYKDHQTRIIKALSPLGISVSRMPKNNFFEAETQILDLIDSVNRTFAHSQIRTLGDIRRQYL